jgi:uncharacterized protein YqeY
MSLKTKIEAEIKQAMLNKDKERLTPLRAIKALILLAESEKGGGDEMSEEVELKLLTKAAKQRKDSLAIYREQNREDLAAKEESELAVIEEFLPKQMTEEELEQALKEIITQVGASGPQDMGKVMGVATKKFAGVADGKTVSMLTKKLLS